MYCPGGNAVKLGLESGLDSGVALLKQHGVSLTGMSLRNHLPRYSLRCGEWCEELHFWVGSLDR